MRLFEILDKMNVNDAENNTSFLGVCNDVVSINQNGQNGKVTIGVPGYVAQDLVLERKNLKPILLIVDLDEYNKIKNS